MKAHKLDLLPRGGHLESSIGRWTDYTEILLELHLRPFA